MTEIMKFGDYIEDNTPKLGCLMLYFAFSDWREFIRRMIPEEDLYVSNDEDDINNYGYEDESHCTILYPSLALNSFLISLLSRGIF